MERADLAAVDASDACNDVLDESRRRRAVAEDSGVFEMCGNTYRSENPDDDIRRSEGVHLNAEAEDMQADWQASVVVLFADDALRRFARSVLVGKQSDDAYEPAYNAGVRFRAVYRTPNARQCATLEPVRPIAHPCAK